MKITVTMPAFNAAQFIDEAIESVLAQSFKSFELVIMDDGSTDQTWRRVQSYRRHPRVRAYRQRRNRGVGATRNRLVQLAIGKYISPCDSDDLLLPGALERLSAVLDDNPRTVAVYGDVLDVMTDASRRVVRPPFICGKDYRSAWDFIENPINHGGSMIRKTAILAVGGYDEAVYSVDDWSLWLKLVERWPVTYLRGEIYYIWRRHPLSLTQTDRTWVRDVERIRNEAVTRRYRGDRRVVSI